MNPNGVPPWQQMPMTPHQRQHVPYGRHQMSPHQGYPHYYAQPMGPMMPPYPHYQQQWYPPPYQPQYQQPYHSPRTPYYQPSMQPPPQFQQHHGPLVVSSQPHMPATPRSYAPVQQTAAPPRAPSLTSTASASNVQLQTPPSRPVSQVSTAQEKRDELTPATTTASPEAHEQSTPIVVAKPAPEPFDPPLPWSSKPNEEFPTRAPRSRRSVLRSEIYEPLYFPPEFAPSAVASIADANAGDEAASSGPTEETVQDRPSTPTQTLTTAPSETQSDHMSTQPTTPSSAVPPNAKSQKTPTQPKPSRVAVPVVPVMPAMPTSPVAARKTHRDSIVSAASKPDSEAITPLEDQSISEPVAQPAPAPPPAPKSWAELVRKQAAANGLAVGNAASVPMINGLAVPKGDTLGEVLGEINIADAPSKIAFLQPRGLVNTGNMCYMNSILQVLVFCVPFYDFLDKVGQKAAHNFKSNTPLVDAMIMFMKEYNSIDTASSVEQLRLRLKPEDLENYGNPLRPDFVYETINKLPRFRDMRRGHQQDAQEFLGFLLEELHEECALAMHRSGASASSGRSTPVGSASNMSDNADTQDGWHEVGHKQKSAITRSSGATNADSPVTSIFGGNARSELKVPGSKMSVTLEAFQSLQLDIGSPQVSNIVDALKGLTKPESMQGEFTTMRGPKAASATKQIFIETLPPVLILHLKRFHYDSVTKRAEKIWKKVGYPLELEIPKEVFQPTTRNRYAAHGGLPKYRLMGVIYHHGRNANGGHYTVDIRRQDGREWIRLDDTLIRRVRSEDVAEGGSEEDPKVLAAALEQHKKQAASTKNRYENIEGDDEEEQGASSAWSQVAASHGRSKSTVGGIINGSATPAKDSSGPQTPRYKDSVKDNKVAYLLFYQRINT